MKNFGLKSFFIVLGLSFFTNQGIFPCIGFYEAMKKDEKNDFYEPVIKHIEEKKPFGSDFSCSCKPEWTLSINDEKLTFCSVCLLNCLTSITYGSVFPELVIEDDELNKNPEAKFLLSINDSDIVTYNSKFLNKHAEALKSYIKSDFLGYGIEPLIKHSCSNFRKATAPLNFEVEDSCLSCYQKQVLAKTAEQKDYLAIIPASCDFKTRCKSLAANTFFESINRLYLDFKKDSFASLISDLPENITVDTLLVTGDHGHIGFLFGIDAKTWQEKIIAPLSKKKFKARKIVIDACYTACMIPSFLPLLTETGVIIGGIKETYNNPLARTFIDLSDRKDLKHFENIQYQFKTKENEHCPVLMAVPLGSANKDFVEKLLQKAIGDGKWDQFASFFQAAANYKKQLVPPNYKNYVKDLKIVQKDRKELVKLLSALKKEHIPFESLQAKLNELTKSLEQECSSELQNQLSKEYRILVDLFMHFTEEVEKGKESYAPSTFGIYSNKNKTLFYDDLHDYYKESYVSLSKETLPYHDLQQVISYIKKQDSTIKFEPMSFNTLEKYFKQV